MRVAQRHSLQMARALKAKGLSGERDPFAALQSVNASRCVPPLDEDEIPKLAHGAATQADRRTPRAPRHHAYARAGGVSRARGDIDRRSARTRRPTTQGWLAHVPVASGNLVGRGPHALVRHAQSMRPTSSSPSWARVAKAGRDKRGPVLRYMFTVVEAAWASACVKSGLSSGRGLIFHVRDPRMDKQPIKEKGRIVAYETVIGDHGGRGRSGCSCSSPSLRRACAG